MDAAAETKSSHPLSQAVLIEKFQNLAGLGVEAIIENKQILVGTIRLMADRHVDITPLAKARCRVD